MCASLVYLVHILADCNKRIMFEISRTEYWIVGVNNKLNKLETGNLAGRFSTKLVKPA